jgi:hypothetical protein
VPRALRSHLAAASLGAAAIHFAVIVPHFDEYAPFGIFFLVVGWFQAIWAILIVASDDRRLLTVGAVANVLVIVVWIASRTVGLPLGPTPWVAEDVGLADVISTTLEAILVGGASLLLVSVDRRDEAARGPVVGASVLVVWSLVVILTIVAIVAEGDAPAAVH